ncbi:MAG: hypothetical protein ACT4P1_10020 [Sporichthyaceae bacterium]
MNTRSQELGRPARKASGSRAATAPRSSTSPWTTQLYVLYAVLAGIGLILFVIGTVIVNDETVYDDQVPAINIAIVGTVLTCAAGISLLVAGRRTLTARRVAVLGIVPAMRASVAVVSGPAASAVLIGGEGLTHFHRADCPMAAGRDWKAASAADHERAGRKPCGVCSP